MTDEVAPITDVSGGRHDPVVRRAAELAISYAAARDLADTYDTAGSTLRRWAGLGTATMAEGDLLESALLSPGSFAEAEAAVLSATFGPDGVAVDSLGWEADAILIRITIELLEEKDQLAHHALEAFDYALGRVIGTVVPRLLLGAPQVSIPLTVLASKVAVPWLEEHPGAQRHLFNSGGGLLDGLSGSLCPGPGGLPFLPPVHPTTEAAAASLAAVLGPEAPAQVTQHPVPVPVAPRSVADLVGNLAAVNGTDATPQPDGAITIQQVAAVDGTVSWIVYAPGTDDPLPWHHDQTVRDGIGNLQLAAGLPTAYGDGLLQAMRRAGIGPPDPVLVVGHSQGGMEAVNLVSNGSEFNITNVVTLGSPTAHEESPPDSATKVLSLENVGDPIPIVVGESNRPSEHHVTVRFDSRAGGFEHELSHYVHGAQAADDSAHPAIAEQVASLHAFLDGTTTGTHGYVIAR